MSQEPEQGMPIHAPPVQKLTEWAQEPNLATLKLDVFNARPHQNTHIQKVNTWLDNLHMTGSAKMTPVRGRSTVQPKLIRKQAEWRYTSLSEPFLSSDKLFTISPRTWEDKAAAEQNELVLNHQFDTKINKVTLVDHFVRTATDEGTVILRTGWRRESKMEKVMAPVWAYFPVNDPQGAEAIGQAIQMVQQNPAALRDMADDVQEAVRYSIEKGGPFRARKMGEQEVDKEKLIRNHPTLEVANIFNLVVDPTCGVNYDEAMFMSYSIEMSIGELKRDGRYKNLDAIDMSRSPLAEPDHKRPTATRTDEFNFSDESRRKLVVQEYWGVYDIDGTGHLTPIVVAWIGEVMIRCELNPFPDGKPPFVIIPLLPLRNSIYGEPDGALLEDNQKIIGAITRGMIDIMARSANAQRGMAKSMLDAVNKRRFDAGQDYEFNPNVHPSQGIVEHKFPEIPASAPAMVQMQNAEAESLTGVQTFGNQGLTGASLGPTAAGTRGVLDATSRREMGILRRLAKGMADVGRKFVAMNQEFLSEEEVIRVTNEQFVKVLRSDLAGEFDLKVDIATADEDEAKASRLEFMLQTLGPNADLDMTKLVLSEIARLRRMPTLAHQVKTFQPAQDPLEQKKKELEIRVLEAEVMEIEAKAIERRAAALLAEAKAREAHSKADALDLGYVEQDTGVKHARDVDKIGAQADSQARAKITEGILHRKNGTGADGKPDTAPTVQNIAEAIAFNGG